MHRTDGHRDHRLVVPRYRPAGWALIAGPMLLVASLDVAAPVAITGAAAGGLLLTIAAVGVHDLGRHRDRTTMS